MKENIEIDVRDDVCEDDGLIRSRGRDISM
jgi:hypothetical protein